MTRGLCHTCWSGNVPIELNPNGWSECGNCKRKRDAN